MKHYEIKYQVVTLLEVYTANIYASDFHEALARFDCFAESMPELFIEIMETKYLGTVNVDDDDDDAEDE